MKRKTLTRVATLVLSVVMLLSVLPMSASASIANWATENTTFEGTSFGTNGYYNVISKKDYTLVPGAAIETEMVLNNAAGNRRQVIHVIEVDPSNPDVSLVPGYYNIDKDVSDVNNHVPAKLTDMAAKYENELGYNIVGGMNTDLTYTNSAPRILVYNGELVAEGLLGNGKTKSYLGVYKDESGNVSCKVSYIADFEKDKLNLYNEANTKPWEEGETRLLQAVGVSFAMCVVNSELVSKTESRSSSDAAARSMVGVKEDGTLVICMNDGRGANNSIGLNNYEIGEYMLSLDCKWAANCDGGGSSTFVSKRAGESDITMRSVPCDGSERPTLHGIFVASNVAPTGVLDKVNIESGYDYFAPGTTYTFDTAAIDTHGYAMDVPTDVTWALSDESFGTIDNGTFVSAGKTGDVDIQVLSGGKVVGTKTIHIANPESLTLSSTTTVLPYSTVDKPRQVTLPIVATVGEFKVFYDTSVFEITSSVAQAGTIDGFKFTATTDESVSSTVITAKYLPTEQTLTYTISFGKGSEVLWNFEDGDISNWLGSDKVREWLTENGVAESNQLKNLISAGQISYSEESSTFLSTKENGGQVHNGDKALGVNFDFNNVEFNSWVYALLFNVQDQYVLRDVANNKKATSLGMWCYVPEGFCNPAGDTAGALSMQLTAYVGASSESYSGTQIHFLFTSAKDGKSKNLSQCTEEDIPESRWVYLNANISGWNYVSLMDPTGTTYREPSFFRMYIKPTRAQVLTYYFDDFTLDYSSAVDDRDAPIISDATYCTADTNIAINGQTIDTNSVSFNAVIADFVASNSEGLDYSTAAIYADGVKLSGVKASGSIMGVEDVVLSNGTHSIKFEIFDKAGNFSTLTKTLTVEADATKANVTLAGHNDSGSDPEYDSIYYADLVASDITKIDSITATLQLNTANTWELDNITAAQGFTVDYDYNAISKLATVTATKTGKCSLTGEQTIVSLPIRVWSFDETTNCGGDGSAAEYLTAAQRFEKYGEPKVFVDVDVVSGAIDYSDKSSATFGGGISVATKLTGNKVNGQWHAHTAVAAADKAATCTEDGYTGRTVCSECDSIVDWGTTIPATGHDYELVDGKFICSKCGDEYAVEGTGLFTLSGKRYYSIAGNLVSGWQDIDDEWYYFNPTTYAGVETLNNGYVTYEFDNGKLLDGVWYTNANGRRYYYGPKYYTGKQAADLRVEIDGNTYYFNKYGYCHEGYKYVKLSNQDIYQWYDFGDDGILKGEWNYTGFAEQDGYKYYVIDGLTSYGMHYVDGAYYYSASANRFAVITNIERNCPVTNGLLPSGTYRFGADGKMLDKTVCNVDGTLYYYELGKICPNATFSFDGTNYSVDSTGKAIFTGTITDGYGVEASYVNGIETLKDGIVAEDGELYYYENNEKVQKGLVKLGEEYYYFGVSYKALKNGTFTLYPNKLYGMLPSGQYTFDADGKIVFPEEAKNGIIEENGNLYYYEDNVKIQKGLVKVGEDYYYFGNGYTAFKNGTYTLYPNKLYGMLPSGPYTFGSDCKIVLTEPKEGIVEENGELYYYENNVKVQKGLVQVGEDYFYFGNSYKAFKNGTYTLYPNKLYGMLPSGQYTFGADCKIVFSEPKEGIVEEDGELYYYENNVKVQKGLVKDGEDYYYFGNSYKAFKNGEYTLYPNKLYGMLPSGQYVFGADCKIIMGEVKEGIVQEDGEYYYYENNVKVKKGLVKVEDEYFYFGNSYKAFKEGTYTLYPNKLYGMLSSGQYTFENYRIVFDN